MVLPSPPPGVIVDSMNQKSVRLHDIATAVPAYRYSQEEALQFMLDRFEGDAKTSRFLRKLYPATAIEQRYSVLPDFDCEPAERILYDRDAGFTPEPSTAKRNDVFVGESNRLAVAAAEKLLSQQPQFDRALITHVVTVTCTGFSAPGFDFHLIRSLGLSPKVHRVHVGFMGCFAAFPALKLARDICIANPDARVLIVDIEVCSLHFQQKRQLDVLVANALFADGAAAALVSAHEDDAPGRSFVLEEFHSLIIDESENDMAWILGETGFDMKLTSYVPALIEKNIGGVVSNLIQGSTDEIDIWAIHPGGRDILDRAADTLGIDRSELTPSYEVLRDFGNMSSVTIFFVLQKILADDRSGTVFAAAFGPGLTVESGKLIKEL